MLRDDWWYWRGMVEMGYCIVTRYCGPTNYRGSRIIGTGPSAHIGGRPTRAVVPFSYAGPHADGDPKRAADAVVAKLRANGWNVTLAGESFRLPDDSGEVWPLRYGTDSAGPEVDDLGIAWEGMTLAEYHKARHDRLYPSQD